MIIIAVHYNDSGLRLMCMLLCNSSDMLISSLPSRLSNIES